MRGYERTRDTRSRTEWMRQVDNGGRDYMTERVRAVSDGRGGWIAEAEARTGTGTTATVELGRFNRRSQAEQMAEDFMDVGGSYDSMRGFRNAANQILG